MTPEEINKQRADAEAALATIQRAQEAAEVERLDNITHVRQFSEGRTDFQAKKDKSRFISLFGISRFTDLIKISRP